MRNAGRETVYWILLLLALTAIAFGIGTAVGGVSTVPDCDCAPCASPAEESAPPDYSERDTRESAETVIAQAGAPSGCDPAELAALRQEIKAITEKYPAEKDGEPLSWPGHIPEQYRSDSFQALFAEALDQIEAPAELAGFDCSEPPCIAQLRPGQDRGVNLARSEVWRKNFGTATREVSVHVRCGDGRQELVQLAAPLWDWKHDPKEMSTRDYDELARAAGLKVWEGRQSEEEAIRDERLRLRLETILKNWRCKPAP